MSSSPRLLALVSTVIFLNLSPILANAADGNAETGANVFRPCRACHQIGETAKNLVGPQLNGVFGRKAATGAAYNYSDAFKALDRVWAEDNFRKYIMDPKADVPGTKMTFPGLKEQQDISDLIAFLKQYGADGKKASPSN